MTSPSTDPVSRFVSAPDGLKLHYAEYGDSIAPGAPVVCLPGLTRTAVDFDPLARALAFEGGARRRVLALDYRGRGLSEHDSDWRRYDVAIENADILAVLTAAEVARAIFVGTSRGGLHAMVLAVARPTLLQAVVLNDIGPSVEGLGLMRIKTTVGKTPPPRSWAEAVDILKRTMSAHFDGLSESDWQTWARMTYAEKDGAFVLRYDPALARTLDGVGVDMPAIDLWPQFMAMADIPTLVVRGANSDLLSPTTYGAMLEKHPKCEGFVAPGQGHAPLLIDAPTIARIAAFVDANG